MIFRPGCAQHIGSRQQQQDSFGFSRIEDAALVKQAGILAVLADGMGGLALGKEAGDASVKAVLVLHETSGVGVSPVDILHDAVLTANEAVLDLARTGGVECEAGSTLVAAILKNDTISWTSVGDSRIYLYRSGELVQLTTDQNFATDLLRRAAEGTIPRDEALRHSDRAALTNYIGNPALKPADSSRFPFPLQDRDWIVLCSDGLFGTLSDDEIKEELSGDPHHACERLIRKVTSKNKPHQDNVTVAILACVRHDPVTVKTRNAGKKERIATPVPRKMPFHLVTTLLIAGLVVAMGLASVFLWPHKPPNSVSKVAKGNIVQPSRTTAKHPSWAQQPITSKQKGKGKPHADPPNKAQTI